MILFDSAATNGRCTSGSGRTGCPRPKPREGTGSRDVRLIHDTAELAGIDPNRWLVQERLHMPEVAIDVFLSRNAGVFCCVCRENIERRLGFPTLKYRMFNDPILGNIAEGLARRLPIFGSFLCQVMRDAASRWQIIDVNPRVGNATRMSAVLGVDFAVANLADFWGEPAETVLTPLTGEHYVVRQFANYVTS